MISEPHKIKTVKTVPFLSRDERLKALQQADFNTFRLPSPVVTFEMTSQGTGAMSQEQASGLLIGDEAYAGSINFENLQAAVQEATGCKHLCPTHSIRGSHKLMSTTMVKEGDLVLANSMAPCDLTEERAAKLKDLSSASSGDLDLDQLTSNLTSGNVPYVYVELFADGYRPVTLANLKAVKAAADKAGTQLVLNASRVIENARHIQKTEAAATNLTIPELVREITGLAHVVIMDAGQDCRCNVGGFLATNDPALHEKYQNEVVVFEGLHTYGGMAGRTMEIFSHGLQEMMKLPQIEWIEHQVELLTARLEGLPLIKGADGVYLEADKFFAGDDVGATLAAAIYLKCGIRCYLDGRFGTEKVLPLQIPRLALTDLQLGQIANAVREVYDERANTPKLALANQPAWHDEAKYTWQAPANAKDFAFDCEAYKINTIEHVGVTTREYREKAVQEAGYNTFLLMSKDISIDLLTDSGTSAQSIVQWQKYLEGEETQATTLDYQEFVETLQDVTGYKYILPTHQGRAAEHIMSQVLISGGHVPGNMFFTTTKLHQEMAGGTFADVIVDEAHQPESTFEWKGNVDLKKLQKLVDDHGAESLPYISFEFSVNMAGGQPVSMDNAKEVYEFCKKHGILVMFDATRCAENAYMIKNKDPRYKDTSIKDILRELFSYGDGCTVSSKKDCLVNIGGFLAYKDREDIYQKSLTMLRKWEGSAVNGGMSSADMNVHAQGVREMVELPYIRGRVEQTRYLGQQLLDAGIPIVQPPGSHAIFLDARRFLPHIDQDQFPAQALASAVYTECGVRAMERGNVSKGRNPATGENYRPPLELVRLTIPRRAYTRSHMDTVAKGIISLYKRRDTIKGLRFIYEPKMLRFFQGRFEEI